jgi:hypothetical protein
MLDPNKAIAGPLVGHDLINLIAILRRTTYQGLEEAEVGISLAGKLSSILNSPQAPTPEA